MPLKSFDHAYLMREFTLALRAVYTAARCCRYRHADVCY